MAKKLQRPGQKPSRPGEYVEKGPKGQNISKPRQITIEPGDDRLPPTQKPKRTWQRIGKPRP